MLIEVNICPITAGLNLPMGICITRPFTGLKIVDMEILGLSKMTVETGRRDELVRYYSLFYNLTVNADTFCIRM